MTLQDGASHDGNTVSIFGPDFPFAYDAWLNHKDGIGSVPERHLGKQVAIVGAGVSGMVAALELMRMGLHPVIYESGRIGNQEIRLTTT